MFKFESLIVWQKSVDFVDSMIIIAEKFPSIHRYTIGTQLIRASLSILNNIAEATGRRTGAESKNLFNIAKGSAYEVVTMLILMKKRSLISKEEFDKYYQKADEICRMLSAFISVSRNSGTPLSLSRGSVSRNSGTPLSLSRVSVSRNSGTPLSLSRVSVSRGFTLLELLLAAAIFSSITLISVSTFTKMNGLNDRAREMRTVSESGRFIIEDIARSISSANGDDGYTAQSVGEINSIGAQSVQLCTVNNNLIVRAKADSPAKKLVAVRTDANTANGDPERSISQYYLDPTNEKRLMIGRSKINLKTGSNVESVINEPLTSENIEVVSFNLYGQSAVNNINSQPYVTIELTIKALPLRATQLAAEQTFRTSVVARDYSFLLPTRTDNSCRY